MEHKNTCKAVIYQRDFNHVLMLEKRFPDSRFHYTLPGGVTDPGEKSNIRYNIHFRLTGIRFHSIYP
ncbi:hypothetical protein [Desulfogranum marinum]|uniref:hypothetical protein n=1 Tax=Desulfogranum marinum TaxID=453220 RepID=UPI0029C7959E|nr:hypothetical protein [Desulfogranum marinum]